MRTSTIAVVVVLSITIGSIGVIGTQRAMDAMSDQSAIAEMRSEWERMMFNAKVCEGDSRAYLERFVLVMKAIQGSSDTEVIEALLPLARHYKKMARKKAEESAEFRLKALEVGPWEKSNG